MATDTKGNGKKFDLLAEFVVDDVWQENSLILFNASAKRGKAEEVRFWVQGCSFLQSWLEDHIHPRFHTTRSSKATTRLQQTHARIQAELRLKSAVETTHFTL